jgi:hypothetical protein
VSLCILFALNYYATAEGHYHCTQDPRVRLITERWTTTKYVGLYLFRIVIKQDENLKPAYAALSKARRGGSLPGILLLEPCENKIERDP